MFNTARFLAAAAIANALTLAHAAPISAQVPDLSGRTVQMIIGFAPGGGYDHWGRIVGRHIGKYLPGKPNVVPQNMPGGGSLTGANHIYNVAPKDGTALGIIARDATLAPLSGMKGARFDPLKTTWVGTPTTDTNVCFVHRRAKVQTFEDLLKHELIIGNNGVGTGTYSYPNALNGLLGTKFKQVAGYKVSVDVILAMERGEVDGYCQTWDSAYNARAQPCSRTEPSRSCSRPAPSCIPTSRRPPSSALQRLRSRSWRSNTSISARASGVRSSRRPTCRPPW